MAACGEPTVPDRVFVDAREVRSIAMPQLVRALGEVLGVTLGVATVEGRLLAAFDFTETGRPRLAGGLVVATEGRADQSLVLGLEVLATGRFEEVRGSDGVVFEAHAVPRLDLGVALRRIEAAAWASHGAAAFLRDDVVSATEMGDLS